jgi:hypothetical protein
VVGGCRVVSTSRNPNKEDQMLCSYCLNEIENGDVVIEGEDGEPDMHAECEPYAREEAELQAAGV